jgi:type III restriction enzyme
MELKPYQQKVLTDLESYLDYVQQDKRIDSAFNNYWINRIGEYNPITGKGMKPYVNSVPGAVHVCAKVPTAGGKTFIACNALKTIFDAYDDSQVKAVVWLVPWSNLLSQTVKALSNPEHPYRRKLNALFNGRVEVYEKKDLLQGTNFNPTVVTEQLSIFVMSFGSIRSRKKEDRKIYEENGQLAQFAEVNKDASHVLPETDETALINIIRSFKPVIVLDESHNAESELSTDMLQNLNPSFILDLTATPKDKSNIVSFVNALELKKEHMVKLPVIVYNHYDKNEVINSALHLQRQLELLAEQEEREGGKYIRPIVLFQAQPRTRDENIDFRKLKEKLLSLGIPQEQIKIKTAEINELKDEDLMSKECKVKYIITVNALKEGWDCPFAYILASLADKSSAVDVEQILGRVLRQPHVMQHKNYQLNLSYVLTASAKFQETLQNIVNGLQNAGFSKNDYRSTDKMPEQERAVPADAINEFLFPEQQETEEADDIDTGKISYNPNEPEINGKYHSVEEIETLAKETNERFEKLVEEQEKTSGGDSIFIEIPDKVNEYRMRETVADIAQTVQLPHFYMQVTKSLFHESDWHPLNQVELLNGFNLSTQDSEINFAAIHSDLYKVDLEEGTKGEYSPKFIQIDNSEIKEPLVQYILSKPKEEQIKDIASKMVKRIGDMYPIPDQHIRKYVSRVIEDMSSEELYDFLMREHSYADAIRSKIRGLADLHAEKKFRELLNARLLKMEYDYSFPSYIVPGRTGASVANSLYEQEGEMNGFEARVISELAALSNIAFWHRNLSRGKGFAINGYKSNHYPDFIIVTKKGHVVVLETKGNDRDNSDSAAKNRLGREWANRAGENYSYFMVFDNNRLEDTLSVEEAKNAIRYL